MESIEKMVAELYENAKSKFISAWKYDFLLTDEYLSFFTNQESVFADHSKMALGAAHLGYSDTTNRFDITIRDYLCFDWLEREVNKTERVDLIELWRMVRNRYNEKYVDQNVERLLKEKANNSSPDEIVAAIVYCTIRAERLCTGFFVSCCENGLIGRLLLQLKEIKDIELAE